MFSIQFIFEAIVMTHHPFINCNCVLLISHIIPMAKCIM